MEPSTRSASSGGSDRRVRPRFSVAPIPGTQWAVVLGGVAACGLVGWLAVGNRMGSAPPNLSPGPTPGRAALLPTPAPPVGMQRSATVVAVTGQAGVVRSDSKSVAQAEEKAVAQRTVVQQLQQAVTPPQVVITALAPPASHVRSAVPLSEAERTAVAVKEAMRPPPPPPGTPVVGAPASFSTPAAAAAQGGSAIPVSKPEGTRPPAPGTGTLVLPPREALPAPVPTSPAVPAAPTATAAHR